MPKAQFVTDETEVKTPLTDWAGGMQEAQVVITGGICFHTSEDYPSLSHLPDGHTVRNVFRAKELRATVCGNEVDVRADDWEFTTTGPAYIQW